jgi:hypothetical protein
LTTGTERRAFRHALGGMARGDVGGAAGPKYGHRQPSPEIAQAFATPAVAAGNTASNTASAAPLPGKFYSCKPAA